MVFLDNSSTMPLADGVLDEVYNFLSTSFANPSSAYDLAEKPRQMIEDTRAEVAKFINAEPEQIIFTSGATESNAMALYKKMFVLSNPTEHDSILSFDEKVFDYYDVDRNGTIDINSIKYAFNYDTFDILVAMLVNNETGVIQPIKEIAEVAHQHKTHILCDATAAFGHIPIDVKELNVDYMSMSFHKIAAFKGVGALYCKEPLSFQMIAGHQQNGQRGGTENVPGIYSTYVALGQVEKKFSSNLIKLSSLRGYLEEKLKKMDFIKINAEDALRAPHIVNFQVKDVASEELLAFLEWHQIYCSSGSACNSASGEPSHVLKRMGLTDKEANSSIRVSFSPDNTYEQIDALLGVITEFYHIKNG